jgi:hypothetical protein
MGLFKSAFRPSKQEIWESLRQQVGGEVISGSFLRGDKLQVKSGDWAVTLDEYTQMVMAGKVFVPISHTRMRAPFPNPTGFRFSIYRASVFSPVGKLLGMQDIQVGHEEFDKDFVIKGNDEAAVKRLFGNERLRELVTAQPKFQLAIHDDEGWFGTKYPPNVDVLVFDIVETIRDVARLKGLYDIFAETLEEVSEKGLATDDSAH